MKKGGCKRNMATDKKEKVVVGNKKQEWTLDLEEDVDPDGAIDGAVTENCIVESSSFATQQIPEPFVGFQMKQTIVRPPIPPTQNHLEPFGPATSGTSGSLFTFMPTPDFRPPTNT
ncbi:hypothetical protein HN51_024457 [Arachis hypogaea]